MMFLNKRGTKQRLWVHPGPEKAAAGSVSWFELTTEAAFVYMSVGSLRWGEK